MFFRVILLACIIVAFSDASDAKTTTHHVLIPGSPVKITNATELQELVQKVMNAYNDQSTDPNRYISVEVIDATEQMVAGTNYDLTLRIGRTNCPKKPISGKIVCIVQDKNTIKKVRARFYVNLQGESDGITFDKS